MAVGFWSFRILLFIISHSCVRLFLVPYSFFVFCCWRRGVSRCKPCRKGSRVPARLKCNSHSFRKRHHGCCIQPVLDVSVVIVYSRFWVPLCLFSPLGYRSQPVLPRPFPPSLPCGVRLAVLQAVSIRTDILGPNDTNAFRYKYRSQKCDLSMGLLAGHVLVQMYSIMS